MSHADGRPEGSETAWIVLAGLALLDVVLLVRLITWCLGAYDDVDGNESWLLLLAISPVLAWTFAFRFARTDWPNNPARLIAASVVGLAAVLGALLVRALVSGGM